MVLQEPHPLVCTPCITPRTINTVHFLPQQLGYSGTDDVTIGRLLRWAWPGREFSPAGSRSQKFEAQERFDMPLVT